MAEKNLQSRVQFLSVDRWIFGTASTRRPNSSQPYIAGEVFSMADITVIGGLIFAGLVDLPVPAECELLLAWYARVQERPSVRNRVTMSEPNPTSV